MGKGTATSEGGVVLSQTMLIRFLLYVADTGDSNIHPL